MKGVRNVSHSKGDKMRVRRTLSTDGLELVISEVDWEIAVLVVDDVVVGAAVGDRARSYS